MAWLATICPSGERMLQKFGRVSPPGHSVANSTPPRGMRVTFRTYARAFVGIWQTFELDSVKVRLSPACRYGGPNELFRPSKLYSARVSMRRHGETET